MAVKEVWAAYYRLSNEDDLDNDESNSITNQRLLIWDYLSGHPKLNFEEVKEFSDDGYSGTNFNRPAFQAMMKKMQNGEIMGIIVKDLSRLGRDTIETQEYMEKIFPFLGVRLIAINDDYDSTVTEKNASTSEMKFKNLINGIYPEICSQNIKAVLRQCAKQGKYLGAAPPYGYCFADERKVFEIDEEAAETVRYIFQSRIEGSGYTDIARDLNKLKIEVPSRYLERKYGYQFSKQGEIFIWSRKAIKRVLNNPVYIGVTANHKTVIHIVSQKYAKNVPKEEWICVSDTHDAIISKEDFKCVKQMEVSRGKCKVAKKKATVFSGKLRCGHCKKGMTIRADHKNANFFCTTPKLIEGTECATEHFLLAELESTILKMVKSQAVWSNLTQQNVKKMNHRGILEELRRKKVKKEQQLERVNARKLAAYESYRLGRRNKEEYLKVKMELTEISQKDSVELEAIENKIVEHEQRQEISNSPYIQAFSKYTILENLTIGIVEELIDVIYIYDKEHIEIIWNFQDDYEKLMGAG